jgi:anhydro-N-acetylmuramic acid kinase
LFNAGWLDARTGGQPAASVQATLLQLTADTIAADVTQCCAGADEVIVCGGGARNGALMKRLEASLARNAPIAGAKPPALHRTDDFGVPSNQVEALAFAWLAMQRFRGGPGNLPAVTGARGRRILGAVYPA